MKRVSTQLPNMDMQYHLRLREWKMNEMQNKIAGQTRILNLRDDPVAAAHSVRFKSALTRLTKFADNVGTIQSQYRTAEGYMQETVNILQRVREIAVTGAHGTFSKQQTTYMAEEVNQLLNELVEIGNARGPKGTYLFAGDRNQSEPFRTVEGHVREGVGKVITDVEYVGTIHNSQAEISDGSYVNTGVVGNRVFWAEQQTLIASRDAANYQVPVDSAIMIDGTEIQLRAGDTAHAIIAKINSADVPVKAKLDPVQNSLVLQTTTPHQLWMEDVGESTVLKDLGVLSENSYLPPNNIADDARITGGSMYDMIIHLRDSLYNGDVIDTGGSALRGIDSALNNVLTEMAELGAQDERLQFIAKRIDAEIPKVVGNDSRETDLDMAAAITNLKMLEYTHKAALQTAGRILRPTLLDFLR